MGRGSRKPTLPVSLFLWGASLETARGETGGGRVGVSDELVPPSLGRKTRVWEDNPTPRGFIPRTSPLQSGVNAIEMSASPPEPDALGIGSWLNESVMQFPTPCARLSGAEMRAAVTFPSTPMLT
jgi:hypothetical protein